MQNTHKIRTALLNMNLAPPIALSMIYRSKSDEFPLQNGGERGKSLRIAKPCCSVVGRSKMYIDVDKQPYINGEGETDSPARLELSIAAACKNIRCYDLEDKLAVLLFCLE